jgi:hypothetical protein
VKEKIMIKLTVIMIKMVPLLLKKKRKKSSFLHVIEFSTMILTPMMARTLYS